MTRVHSRSVLCYCWWQGSIFNCLHIGWCISFLIIHGHFVFCIPLWESAMLTHMLVNIYIYYWIHIQMTLMTVTNENGCKKCTNFPHYMSSVYIQMYRHNLKKLYLYVVLTIVLKYWHQFLWCHVKKVSFDHIKIGIIW